MYTSTYRGTFLRKVTVGLKETMVRFYQDTGSMKVLIGAGVIIVGLIAFAQISLSNDFDDTSSEAGVVSDPISRDGDDGLSDQRRASDEYALLPREGVSGTSYDEARHRPTDPEAGGSGRNHGDTPASSEGAGAGRSRGGAVSLGEALAKILMRRGAFSGSRSNGFSGDSGDAVEEDPPPEYESIRRYLTDFDEEPAEVRDVADILADPSNIVTEEGAVTLLAWDRRDREPRGSYLNVLQQDPQSRLLQIHRYFCLERRLDVMAGSCIPIASVYSESGAPRAVRYDGNGQPIVTEPDDLDPSQFSRGQSYVESNELLLYLQEYFDSMR